MSCSSFLHHCLIFFLQTPEWISSHFPKMYPAIQYVTKDAMYGKIECYAVSRYVLAWLAKQEYGFQVTFGYNLTADEAGRRESVEKGLMMDATQLKTIRNHFFPRIQLGSIDHILFADLY